MNTGMQSGLAMSRSIGDWDAGKLGVIPDPLVKVIDIPELVEAQMDGVCQVGIENDGIVEPACSSTSDDVYVFAVSATDGMMGKYSCLSLSPLQLNMIANIVPPHYIL